MEFLGPLILLVTREAPEIWMSRFGTGGQVERGKQKLKKRWILIIMSLKMNWATMKFPRLTQNNYENHRRSSELLWKTTSWCGWTSRDRSRDNRVLVSEPRFLHVKFIGREIVNFLLGLERNVPWNQIMDRALVNSLANNWQYFLGYKSMEFLKSFLSTWEFQRIFQNRIGLFIKN